MSIRLGEYRVEWDYDPDKHITFCSIKDSENLLVANSSAQLAYKASYDKARVRMVTFNKALKNAVAKGTLSKEVSEQIRSEFKKLPNKGVI